MLSIKWWLAVALVGIVLAAKFWYPQGGEVVKDVFFGESPETVAVFGGDT